MKRRYNLVILLMFLIIIPISIYRLRSSRQGFAQIEIVDVVQNESIKAEKDSIIVPKKFVHISLDDFIIQFKDITDNDYESLFENEIFNFFKNLHDRYGVVISLYTFFEDSASGFNLSQVTDRFAHEFEANSDWLRFGFHSYNGDTNYDGVDAEVAQSDYDRVIEELIRITGSEKSIDRIIRLHNYAGDEVTNQAMKNTELGIMGFLGPDDKRMGYGLDEEETSYLYLYDYFKGDTRYFKTDIRLESVDDVSVALNDIEAANEDMLIIFSHESLIGDKDIQEKMVQSIVFAVEEGYTFAFPMDRVNE